MVMCGVLFYFVTIFIKKALMCRPGWYPCQASDMEKSGNIRPNALLSSASRAR